MSNDFIMNATIAHGLSLQQMLGSPGRYIVSNMNSPYGCRVEVDENRKCFQLNHALERDGELSEHGWRNPEQLVITRDNQ